MKQRRSWLCLTVVLASFASGSSARAETQLYLNLPGITGVGTWGGRTVAATLSLFGCTFQDLAPASHTTDYVLHGTSGNDTINVVRVATSWCGLILQPIIQNSHYFHVSGGAGDDVISAPNADSPSGNGNWIYGEAGNDILYMGPGGSEADGGDGNDIIYGTDNASDILLGGAGNDTLCEHSTSLPLVQRGGDGYDTACAAGASHGQFLEIEAINCAACGPGY